VNNDDGVHRENMQNLIKVKLEQVNHGEADRPLYKIKGDPRVAPVGRLICKSRIDELSQIFSVQKGDMGFVGPRPVPTRQRNTTA
jgi:lipopolysaccharide/colanic/teichoic acid biosynthesis glycosyltransferase